MKKLKYTIGLLMLFIAFTSCEDENDLGFLDSAEAPSNIKATFEVMPDNSGMVTITPSADGATSFWWMPEQAALWIASSTSMASGIKNAP